MMECLKRIEIQRYIDGEVSSEEMSSFNRHKELCKQCQLLWLSARKEIKQVNELISLARPADDILQKPKRIHAYKNHIILASAAAGLALTLLLQYRVIQERKENRIRAAMEIQRLLMDSDPNEMWVEKQTVVIITDKNGNLINSEL